MLTKSANKQKEDKINGKQGKFLNDISKKLNILISLTLRNLLEDKSFAKKPKRGTGELVNYLANFDLDAENIADILGSPIQSIRTLLTPKRRKK